METPIYNFVKKYAESGISRLHMPGHKGSGPLGIEAFDITEIAGADVLSEAEGIIGESEKNLTSLYNSGASFYSTEGSTLCIKTMLKLVSDTSPKGSVILAARNAHKAFLYGIALLDLDVKWMYSKMGEGINSCTVTKEEVEKCIKSTQSPVSAVYITSPDYLGNLADVKGIAKVCHRYGVKLLVDNAHGAYLNFLNENVHPINLGADMCCDSAHKTLRALTGAAYLHISKNTDRYYIEAAKQSMELFASTSPSYLILCSLDLCNNYLATDFSENLLETALEVQKLKEKLLGMGFALVGNEPLKVSIKASEIGYTGYEMAEILRENKVECEFCDPEYLSLMISASTAPTDIQRVREAFEGLEKRESLKNHPPKMNVTPKLVMSARCALMSKSEKVEITQAKGRICASVAVSCPPAIPIAVCGQIIEDDQIELFKYYGIENCRVVIE
jgi:arginine/lysine/ornithine decarboxylase